MFWHFIKNDNANNQLTFSFYTCTPFTHSGHLSVISDCSNITSPRNKPSLHVLLWTWPTPHLTINKAANATPSPFLWPRHT
ncbi:hypothetical protein ACRALDRAFT_1063563, partial [Sodiomyces alcalophilus JCM 7366]|uniref:uncharacterized protein n=1 Tax=Sodiomyces alcalophilus JCM 7366 TaxID=591952 RepID=UPI0039B40C55